MELAVVQAEDIVADVRTFGINYDLKQLSEHQRVLLSFQLGEQSTHGQVVLGSEYEVF